MATGPSISNDTEIRKFPISIRDRLAHILDVNDAWKELMGAITVDGTSRGLKYNYEDIRIIEDEAKRRGVRPFEVLIDEWGTSGKRRPVVADLINLLIRVENFQAADYLSNNILKFGPVQRPQLGPSAPISTHSISIQQMLTPLAVPATTNFHSSILEPNNFIEAKNEILQLAGEEIQPFNSSLPHISYSALEYITDNFNLNPVGQMGRKLGAGAFGTVFLGGPSEASPDDPLFVQIYRKLKIPLQSKVAVKRLHSEKVDLGIDIQQLFRTEVELMSRYTHENLLKLLGYSTNGPDSCLVYAYMPNGSLEARLACEGGSPPLQWNNRLDIAHGVAEALIYLHTAYEQPLVHRDVKSANVLLNEHLKPKLGDFGLVRYGSSGSSKSKDFTTNIVGTSAYMADEAFRGDVSVKMDTFSFGVILLELLTGLPAYQENRNGRDLISHIESACEDKEFIELLDSKIPPLPEEMVTPLHAIVLSCQNKKERRPMMQQVYKDLCVVGRGDLLISV